MSGSSSINPTVKLAETRSYIDTVQSKLSQLEMIFTNLMALAAENNQRLQGDSVTIAEIHNDFEVYVASRGELTEEQQLEVIGGLVEEIGTTLESRGIEIPDDIGRNEIADAWVEFAEATEDPTVVKQAITVLKASLGAARNEESAWRQEQESSQKIRRETNKHAEA